MTKTTFLKTMLFALAIMVGSANAWGQTPQIYDDFTSYSAGTLANQGSWARSGTGTDLTVTVPGTALTYSGYNGGGGNYVVTATANTMADQYTKAFTTGTNPGTNTFYYSFLLNVSSAPSTGSYFFSIKDGASGTNYIARTWIKTNGVGYVLGVSTQATAAYGATVLSFNTTYLVVVSYESISGTANDLAKIWINPSLAANLIGNVTPEATQTSAGDPSNVSYSVFSQRNQTSNNSAYSFDGLRVSYGATSATAWTNLAAVSSISTPPTLSPDITANTVDNFLDITFTDDATWRGLITAVKVGSTALTANTDYIITAGTIRLKPSGLNALLTASGSKSISVVATGYSDATVTQVIGAGAPTANSTATMAPGLITCTAKDQYNNLVSGYTFKYDLTIINNNATTAEAYTIDGTSRSTTTAGISVIATTDISGVATITAALAPVIDPADGISMQIKLNDGTTNVGSAFGYLQLQSQSISFGSLSAATYGNSPITLSATATSALPVSFSSSNTSIAQVSGTTLTILGAGTVTITASQSGDATYNAALSVPNSLVINPATLTIPGAVVSSKVYDGTNTAVITGNLSGILNSDNVTLSGSGTFADVNVANGIAVTSASTLGGSKAGSYTLTQPTGLTGNITKANQTITFTALTAKTTADADFSPGATSATSATNAITYSSSNTTVATIVGGNIHIVGGGTTNITASQAGSTNYNAASDVIQALTVTAHIVPNVIITQVYGAGGNSGATYTNDFVELYNTTGNNIDISAWSIQYYPATGTGASTNFYALPANTTIKAYSYFLVQCAGGSVGTALPTPDATASFNMSSTAGKVVLFSVSAAQSVDATLGSITGNAAFIDYVPYGSTSTPVYGSSTVNLSATTAAIRKSSGGTFVHTGNVGNDFNVATPYPRNTGSTTQAITPVENLSVSASNSIISFRAEAGAVIELYNALGQKILVKQAINGLNSIPVEAKGLIVLKVGNRIAKLIM